MSTLTPRLKIIKPDYTEPADIATINAAMDTVDGTAGLIICTEATKPTTHLFIGMYIKCTDSTKHYLNLTGLTTGWVEDTYGTSVIINLTGSGAVFYGARLSRPYVVGMTGGDSSPFIDQGSSYLGTYNNDTGLGTGDGRNFYINNFAVAVATRAEIDFSAFVQTGTGTGAGVAPTVSHVSGPAYDLSLYIPVRFDLFDNGAYVCTLGRAVPALPAAGTEFNTSVNATTVIPLATGNHQFDVRIYLEGTQAGLTVGAVLCIAEASFKVALSA